MLEIVRRLFNHEKSSAKSDGLTQGQREALIDLLVLAEFKDNHIAEAEVLFVQNEASRHPWQSTVAVENFYDASVARTRSAAVSAVAREDYLADIVERLKTPAARKRAYDLCLRLMGIDGECSPPEQAFLTDLWNRLQAK